jgi:hypothetical protein
MRSALGGLKGVFSRWTILDKVGRFRALPAFVHWCTWRRTGWPARPRGARKCHERLAGEQLGLVRLGWLTTGGRELSRKASKSLPKTSGDPSRGEWHGERQRAGICVIPTLLIFGLSQKSGTRLAQISDFSRATPDRQRRKNFSNFSGGATVAQVGRDVSGAEAGGWTNGFGSGAGCPTEHALGCCASFRTRRSLAGS